MIRILSEVFESMTVYEALFVSFCAWTYATTNAAALPTRPSYVFGRSHSTNTSPMDGATDIGSVPTSEIEKDTREQLYGAYNELHSLAQDFKKPFDSPAVLVVGHQTSGKSALMEAIMGFQFNQVFTSCSSVCRSYSVKSVYE